MVCPYQLASEIEWINAAARVRMTPRRRGQRVKDLIASEYDPHAATELGMLLDARIQAAVAEASQPGTKAEGRSAPNPSDTPRIEGGEDGRRS